MHLSPTSKLGYLSFIKGSDVEYNNYFCHLALVTVVIPELICERLLTFLKTDYLLHSFDFCNYTIKVRM